MADVTSPNVAHAYWIMGTSRAHTAKYIQECFLLSYSRDLRRTATQDTEGRMSCQTLATKARHVVFKGDADGFGFFYSFRLPLAS